MRYKALRGNGEKCPICGKPIKKGDWVEEGFVRIFHNRCYQRQRKKSKRVNVRKLGQKALYRDLQRMAKATIRRLEGRK